MDWSAIASAANGLTNLGFNIYDRWYQAKNNQRDFDYQAALQRDVFKREDTAVQRRMADLQAAGLNPNLAAGSAASSGAVVGRSNTPGLPTFNSGIGAALDTATAISQLRNQREQNEILKNQQRETKANADMAENARVLDTAELYNLLGITPQVRLRSNGKVDVGFTTPDFYNSDSPWSLYTSLGKNGSSGYTKELNEANARLMQYLNWQYKNNQNSAALLQKDVDWYTADKIANYAGTAAGIFSGIGSGYRSFSVGNRYRR